MSTLDPEDGLCLPPSTASSTPFYLSSKAFMVLFLLFESCRSPRPRASPSPPGSAPDQLGPHRCSFLIPPRHALWRCPFSCGVCAGLLALPATAAASFYHLLGLVGQRFRKGSSGWFGLWISSVVFVAWWLKEQQQGLEYLEATFTGFGELSQWTLCGLAGDPSQRGCL